LIRKLPSNRFQASYVAPDSNRFSLVARVPYESDANRCVVDFGIAGFPYSTICSGFVSGMYRQDQPTHSARAEGVESMYSSPGWRNRSTLFRAQ
jgi:aryl-alcohol dehydrogenase-like predicted oxidoreductase